jgi:hypothetical protein
MALFVHKKGPISSFTFSQMASPLGEQELSLFGPAPQLLLESLNKLRAAHCQALRPQALSHRSLPFRPDSSPNSDDLQANHLLCLVRPYS